MRRGQVVVGALCVLVGLVRPAPASELLATGHASCLRALVDLSAGTTPDSASFESAPCPQAPLSPTFRYDPQRRAAVLTTAIVRGGIVRAFADFDAGAIEPGQTLHLVVTFGAARIERPVQALQSARPGERLFVKCEDGTILSVRYEKAVQ